jgi:putative membrane protein
MTLDALAPAYPWVKALHVIAVIAWMAGMFYLPRLFVYHTQTEAGSRESERFKVMETKLLRVIMTPAMLATWLFGLLLVLTPGAVDWSSGWWHLKLLGVVAMTGLHGMFARYRRDFLHDRNRRPERFFRAMNEAPTVALVVIVIMVVVKPF